MTGIGDRSESVNLRVYVSWLSRV